MKNNHECVSVPADVAVFTHCAIQCRRSLVSCLNAGHADSHCGLSLLHCADTAQFAAISAASSSPHMKSVCELCIQACNACIAACEAQGGHEECIECCRECIAMCEQFCDEIQHAPCCKAE